MSVREKFSSFDKKNLSALVILSFSVIMLAGYGFSQSSGQGDVVIGQNGVDINSGQLMMNGNDIVDGGSTIWDASAGNIATSAVDYSVVNASDVGLGNVENEAQVAEGGDSMSGNLDIDSNKIQGTNVNFIQPTDGNGDVKLESGSEIDFITDNGGTNGGPYSISLQNGGTPEVNFDGHLLYDVTRLSASGEATTITSDSNQNIVLDAQFQGSSNDCVLNGGGDIDCDGTISASSKNFVQSINKTHELVYTSQESPQVRAVYEGKAYVKDSKKIELPSHFSKTVSDSEPMLRAQVTPQGTLTNAAAMKVTDDYIDIAVEKETEVHYRVTGVRDGYEDKQVVREKE